MDLGGGVNFFLIFHLQQLFTLIVVDLLFYRDDELKSIVDRTASILPWNRLPKHKAFHSESLGKM